MEGKPGKIFGSNPKVSSSKVSNPKGQTYMFGMDSVGKYSVQIQKFQIQMVNIICSEWIPLENISFKIGIFIDWKVVRLPPPGVLWDDKYVSLPYMVLMAL